MRIERIEIEGRPGHTAAIGKAAGLIILDLARTGTTAVNDTARTCDAGDPEAIGSGGAFIEHMDYWDYALSMGHERGVITAWALHRKGYELVEGTNLAKVPAWIAFEIVPPVPRTLPVGDANLGPGSALNCWLLLGLMPDNRAAHYIAGRAGKRMGKETHARICGIVLYREARQVAPAEFLPHARHFPEYNMMHLRTGWGPDALSAFIAARWNWGHVHEDVGAFTLWSHGRFWAVDSGYGVGESAAHNMVIVDGRGMPERAAGGEMRQFFDSPLATLATVDATRAWRRRFSGHYDWLRAVPVDSMAKARRVFALMWAEEDVGARPYLLVRDDIMKDREEHRWTWIMGTWRDHRIELAGREATLWCPFNDRWLEGPDTAMDWGESHKHWFEHPVKVPEAGKYDVWAFVRGSENWGGDYTNCWVNGKRGGYMPVGGATWGWKKISRNRVELEAGPATVKIDQRGSETPVRFRWIALSKNPDFDPVEPRLYNTDRTVSAELGEETRLVGDWHWVEAEGPPPKLDVAFLHPEVELRQDIYTKRGRWHREAHPRLLADAGAVNPRFLAVLYPHSGQVESLSWKRYSRYGYPWEIRWPGAVDYIGTHRTRKSSGKGYTFGTNGHLCVVRCPTQSGWTPLGDSNGRNGVAPGSSYLMVNGTRLQFARQDLVMTEGLKRTGCYLTVALADDRLTIKGMTGPEAQWQIERNATVRAWGPEVEKVMVNGSPAGFERDGDYVLVGVRTEVFVPTRRKVGRQVQRRYNELHGKTAR